MIRCASLRRYGEAARSDGLLVPSASSSIQRSRPCYPLMTPLGGGGADRHLCAGRWTQAAGRTDGGGERAADDERQPLPPEPVRRYERDHPGELIHLDIKKPEHFDRVGHRITGDRAGQSNARGVGWEFVRVAIDDNARIAFSQVRLGQPRNNLLRLHG